MDFSAWRSKKESEVAGIQQKYSALEAKRDELKDKRKEVLDATMARQEFKVYLNSLLQEGRKEWRQWFGQRIDEVRMKKINLFDRSSVNVVFFAEPVHWRWLPAWLSEEDLEAAVDSLPEAPGALSDKERSAKLTAVDREIGEIEKQMAKLLSE